MTIDPGTRIKVNPNVNITVGNLCELTAIGAPDDPIVITRAGVSAANWGMLQVSAPANSASFQHCIIEYGTLFENNQYEFYLSDSIIRYNSTGGLLSNAGMEPFYAVTAEHNGGVGLNAGFRSLWDCVVVDNDGAGVQQAEEMNQCYAFNNNGAGLQGFTAVNCEATSNAGIGIQITGEAQFSSAFDNQGQGIQVNSGPALSCLAARNGDLGFEVTGGGALFGCRSIDNAIGGIVSNGEVIDGCEVELNDCVGVESYGAGTRLTNSRIVGNSGSAAVGVIEVSNSAISGNSAGIQGVADVSDSYIGGHSGDGVSSGTIANCSIVGNQGDGVSSPTTIANSWIVNNYGKGVVSDGTGTAVNCSILDNRDTGAQNLFALNNSNIHGNLNFDTGDDLIGAGVNRNFEYNYWGLDNTVELDAGAPFDNISFIEDSLDGSGNHLIDVWPYTSGTVANAPNTSPPAFLLYVEPNLEEAIQNDPTKVQLTTFTLIFSKAMDTSIEPSTTFDLEEPYTDNIVEPEGASGWIALTTWQGFFAIDSGMGNGLHTLRVAGATDATGFLIPVDTTRRFFIDTGTLSANNGLATGFGDDAILAVWSENNKPTGAKGFNLRRKALLDPQCC